MYASRTMLMTTRTTVGIAAYMDPEVFSGQAQPSSKSDMYAFGVMMAELLLGKMLATPSDVLKYQANLTELQRAVLVSLLSPQGADRPSAADLLANELFANATVCCVCMERYVCDDGLFCESKHNDHFICKDDLSGFVKVESQNISSVQRRKGLMYCPFKGKAYSANSCVCKPWSDIDIASCVSTDAFAEYQAAKALLVEQDITLAVEKEAQAELKQELARLERMDAEERKVYLARKKVIAILELKCPHCKTVFVDFDGCMALTCKDYTGRNPAFGCGKHFCGWCLEATAGDAHAHVRSCKFSRNGASYFAGPNQFQDAQRVRRQKLVEQFVHSMGSEKFQLLVLRACTQELNDLGIVVRTSTGKSAHA